MRNRTSVNQLIPFPRLDSDSTTGPTLCTTSANRNDSAPVARPTSLGHRGLHLMTQSATTATVVRASRQAQADRIVAQIEWEIEQQAARQRERFANGPAASPAPAQNTVAFAPLPIETPATVARRLFAALFSFARTA